MNKKRLDWRTIGVAVALALFAGSIIPVSKLMSKINFVKQSTNEEEV